MRNLFIALALLFLPLADAGAAKNPTREQARAYCEVQMQDLAVVAMRFYQGGVPLDDTVASFTESAEEHNAPEKLKAAVVVMIRAIYGRDGADFLGAYENTVRVCADALTALRSA